MAAPLEQPARPGEILQPLVVDESADIADDGHPERYPEPGGQLFIPLTRNELLRIARIGQQIDLARIDAPADQLFAHGLGKREDMVRSRADSGLEPALQFVGRAFAVVEFARSARHFPEAAHFVDKRNAKAAAGNERGQGHDVVRGGDHQRGPQRAIALFQHPGRFGHILDELRRPPLWLGCPMIGNAVNLVDRRHGLILEVGHDVMGIARPRHYLDIESGRAKSASHPVRTGGIAAR